MTVDTAPTSWSPPPSAPPRVDDWHRRERIFGWMLLVTWVGLMASTLLVGTRESTYAELEARVASGDVTTVEVAGHRLPLGAHGGYSVVVVQWRHGLVVHRAWVTEAGSRRAARREQEGDDRAVVVGRVDERLLALDPDVRLTTKGDLPGSSFRLAGLTVPGWIGFGWLGLLVGCLALVGPRTWRATGWGWTWLILLVPPYGVLAFLVLGGPTGLLPPHEPRRAWLTGGWAFVVALLLGGAANGT